MKNKAKQELENWKMHPDFSFIEVSNLGRVRTLDRVVSNGRGTYVRKGRILKQRDNGHGYLYVMFGKDGKAVTNLYTVWSPKRFCRILITYHKLIIRTVTRPTTTPQTWNGALANIICNIKKNMENQPQKLWGARYMR